MLIDDRADNCTAFRGQGGSAVQWKMGKNDISEIRQSVDRWLTTGATALAPTC
ncbi:MAG TPA: hypothetical protein VFQ77_04315 [Pseudonocardiaceae bacterium]|nr:hypothetical protein [Pseudonocardiaceae bacterium]